MPFENGKLYGSFKKICLNPNEVITEAETISQQLFTLKKSFENHELNDSAVAFQIVLLYLQNRVKKHPFLRMGKKLPPTDNRRDFLEVVRFYGMPDTVRFALWKWNLGDWDLRLIDYNPTSLEMLESQSLGYRYVTFSWESAISGEMIEGKRDAFEHMLHDLAHAYMFFREDYDFPGQKIFFRKMLENYQNYVPFLESDPVFQKKFEYCISDMNSHPAHLEAYLFAICREANFFKEESPVIR